MSFKPSISLADVRLLRAALVSFSIWLFAFSTSPPCGADELGEKGRAIFKSNQHCVTTVEVILKSKVSMTGMPSQEAEMHQEVTGTILDSAGLIVLSLSATDPGETVPEMMPNAKVETQLSEVKFVLEDGSKVPAEVVLRDKELALAFIRPKTKLPAPLLALDLTKSGKAELLDQVVTLNRLGVIAGRTYAASAERIAAVVERPRLFYIPETSVTLTTLGSPAFTLEGKVLGIFALRSQKGGGPIGGQRASVAGVILPAEDILKAAKQAPAATEGRATDGEKK